MPDKNEPYRIKVTPELIAQYRQGGLEGKTRHALERQALDDPFLYETLEGYALREPDQSAHLEDLRRRLKAKTDEKRGAPGSGRRLRYRNAQIAAAAVLLLLVSIGIFFFTPAGHPSNNQLALGKKDSYPEEALSPPGSAEKPVSDTPLAPAVALNTPRQAPAPVRQKKPSLPAGKPERETVQAEVVRHPDTTVVVAYQQRQKQAITGSVVIRNPGDSGAADKRAMLMAARALPAALKRSRNDTIAITDESRLNEAVVVGYGKTGQREIYSGTKARPVGGFAAFRRYVRDSMRYPAEALENRIEGTVKLSFRVLPDSSLQQIRVIGDPGYGCASEAIRLLSEGPPWYPVNKDDTGAAEIKIRFDLNNAEK